MGIVRTFIHALFLLVTVVVISACVPQKSGEKSANCPDGFAFDSKSRSCLAAGRAPQGVSTTITLSEDFTSQFVSLPYTDANGDLAVSCIVKNPFYTSLFNIGTCSCAAGVCQTQISSVTNQSGEGFFSYTVTDSSGESSSENVVNVKINAVNDAPTLAVANPGTLLESSVAANASTGTNTISVNLTAFIVGSDIETTSGSLKYEVRTITSGATLSGCMGAYGAGASASNSRSCTLTVTEQSLGTIASYDFGVRVFDGSSYSAESTITLTVSFDLDDTPTFSLSGTSNSVTPTEDTAFSVSGMQLSDRDSSVSGASCSITSLTNLMQTSACSCNASGSCSASFMPTSDFNGTAAFSASATNSLTTSVVSKSITIAAANDDPVAPLVNVYVLESDTIDGLTYTQSDVELSYGPDANYAFTQYSDFRGYDVDSNITSLSNISMPSPDADVTVSCASLSNTCQFSLADGNVTGTGTYNGATIVQGAGLQTISIRARAPGAFAGMSYQIIHPVGMPSGGGPYVSLNGWALTVYASSTHTLGNIVDAINNSPKAKLVFAATTAVPGALTSGSNTSGSINGGTNPAYVASYTMNSGTKTTSLGRFTISVIPVNDVPVVCLPSSFTYNLNSINGCPEEGCSGDASPIGSVTPKTSGLLYYSKTKGICYKSNTAITNKWEVATSGFIPNQAINEKDQVIVTGIKLHEGGGGNSDAADSLTIKKPTSANFSSNQLLVPDANIQFYYAGVGPLTEAPAGSFDVTDAAASSHNEDLEIRITPVGTLTGTSTISFMLSDGTNEIGPISFTVTVNASSAQHKGWKTVAALGPEIDRFNQVVGTKVCSFSLDKCSSGGVCTGTAKPTFDADNNTDGTIFWDSSNSKCYYYDSAGSTVANRWVEFTSYCPITSQNVEPNCSGASCYESGAPSFTPASVGSSYVDSLTGECYRSVGTSSSSDWKRYMGSGSVTLSWESFNLSGSGLITGFNVYRRLKYSSISFDYKRPINKTPLASSATSYIDNPTNSFTPPLQGAVYEYEVRPIINSIPTQTNEVYKRMRVIVPNVNQAFVHRDVVNKRICTMIAATDIDSSNHNRCTYTGFGSSVIGNLAYYDVGKDFIVDRFELGCNYSKSGCATSDGACIGIDAPAGAANMGALYYQRSNGTCHYYNGVWQAFNSVPIGANLDITQRSPEADEQPLNSSGLPPLVNLDWSQADSVCSNRLIVTGNPFTASAEYIQGIKTGSEITPTLPTRKQQIGYSLWDSTSLSSSTITTREAGLSLNSSAKCNSSQASGLTGGYSDSDTPDSSSIYSLPGTASSNIRSLATGNAYTSTCSSIFGVRDHIGNVKEWLKTGIECDYAGASGVNECQGLTGLDPDFIPLGGVAPNEPVKNYVLNNVIGYCGEDTNNNDICDDTPITSWLLKNGNSFGVNVQSFNVPMGLPLLSSLTTSFRPLSESFDTGDLYNPNTDDCDNNLVTDTVDGLTCSYVTKYATAINSPSLTVSDLHEDGVAFNIANILADSTLKRGFMAAGGSYLDGNGAGVWAFETVPDEATRPDVGVRCLIEVDESDYQ